MDLHWYLRRLSMMGPREIAGRIEDKGRQVALRRMRSTVAPRRVRPRPFPHPLPALRELSTPPPAEAMAAAVSAADGLLQGRWPVLGVERTDMMPVPNWFIDPVSGIETPSDVYSFSIAHRDPAAVGSIKQVWEPSRHHHLTVLAVAYAATGEARYAETVAAHLRDWWSRNQFLGGPHWTSGIEVGIRLISWVWVRRLLAGWEGTEALFDDNRDFQRQVHQHQWFLSAFPSRGSSANNHLVAEAAGLLTASLAFPWFRRSAGWERSARRTLEREIDAQTFPSGINRELASEYQGLVFELFTIAAVEADIAGRPLPDSYWSILRRMSDAIGAVLDASLQPPRQGDADDGHGLLLDAPGHPRWGGLVSLGAALFGDPGWYPAAPATVLSTLLAASARLPAGPPVRPRSLPGERPSRRPSVFPDAGMAILRSASDGAPEIWCRFDAGPHGYLSIAAHGHADALGVEVRHGGVDVLADPGTFTYHGEPEWRAYFRSTRAHNTVELDGEDQSVPAGPFMWSRHARARLEATPGPDGTVTACSGSHDGYERLEPPARHRRRVEIDGRTVVITDDVTSETSRPLRISFHLGPRVECELAGDGARLRWPGGSAVMALPADLTWERHRGSDSPIGGWFSPSFGVKVPAVTLWGSGTVRGSRRMVTSLSFDEDAETTDAIEFASNTGSENGDHRYIAQVGTMKERE